MHRKIAIMMVAGVLVGTVQASLIWTGAGDGISLYQEANWLDDQGNVPAGDVIKDNTNVGADTGTEKLIEISSGTGSPSNAGGTFKIGNNSLTVSGGKTLRMTAADGHIISAWQGSDQVLTVSGGATVSGVEARNFTTVNVDGGTLSLTGAFTAGGAIYTDGFSISNGGSVTALSIAAGFDEDITVDGTSLLELTTTTVAPFALVDLAEGAQLTLSSLDYFTTHGARITVGGVSYAENSSILSFVGTTATAIPEPAVIGLIAMMGGGTLFIRRRFMP